MRNYRVLVVDDETSIVDVIKSYLELNNYEVKCAYNGNEALELYKKFNPDIMILDLMLPDISGEQICKQVRLESRIPIIILSAKTGEESIINGLDIGADDYVIKPFSPKEIVARVNAKLRRNSGEIIPLSNKITLNNGTIIIDNLKHEIMKDNKLIKLTPNEYKIFMTLLSYPNKTFKRDELIEVAFSNNYEGFDRTIDYYIKNIRKKISNNIIVTVHGIGYKIGGDRNEE
jgi:DNA-binding response OmpR family regulator